MKKLLCGVIVFLTLQVMAFGIAQAMNYDEFKGKAEDFLDDKIKTDAFIKMCTAVLSKDVGDNLEYKAYAYGMRGEAYRIKNDKKKALEDAQIAIDTYPKTFVAYMVKAQVLLEDNKIDEAADTIAFTATNTDDPKAKKNILAFAEKTRMQGKAISPVTLWKAFDENEVAAEDTYKGKVVAVKGAIESITTSAMGYPQVSFKADKYGINKVIFEFSKDAKPQIAKLKKGQNIIISGQCRGMIMKSVLLEQSKIID